MIARDAIVIGASGGGTEALRILLPKMPADLAAAIFVAVHLPPGPSKLPSVLSGGPLPASYPRDDQKIEPGHIYVAPPDRHMLIENGHLHVWHGPKENRHRPAINPLFRSAAVAHGARTIGIILSGCLDDGSAGLWHIKRRGGIAIVQDPAEAAFSTMVESAMEYVDVDYTLTLRQMGELLPRLVQGSPNSKEEYRPSMGRGEDAPVWKQSSR
jgi:two-component system chemotaxis response regulator CheB